MAQGSVARVTELSAKSSDSFEQAVKLGVERATKTLRNVQGAWVKEQEVEVDGNGISAYKVVLKVTFELED